MKLSSLIRFLLVLALRIVLLGLSLVFLLGLLAATLLLLTGWSLRALWARLRGRPVQAPVFTILRHARWPGAAGMGARFRAAPAEDVIDVTARRVDAGTDERLGR